MITLLSGLCLAGYGDPMDGVPNYAEREVHLWTNGVRAEPSWFANDYDCSYTGFRPNEQTAQPLLWWHSGLAEIARLHSMDMEASGVFSHSSSDGTSFEARVEPYYSTPFVGENIAQGYPTPWSAVIEGWMCSSGHRANIMLPEYTDLGVGVAGSHWTQDFGARSGDPTLYAARLGLHMPAFPGTEVEFLVAVHTGQTPPDAVDVVLNGVHHPMDLLLGTAANGIYQIEIPVDGEECGAYWFEVAKAGGTVDSYPQDGAYGYGTCPWGDPEARWMLREDVPALQPSPPSGDEEPQGCGCAQANGATGAAGWLALALLTFARRRS